MHAHVSEQPQENAECLAEHGCSPTALLAATGCLTRTGGFTAVHAIHLEAADFALLAGQHVCACPTTEADLGDGIIPATDHLRGGPERRCLRGRRPGDSRSCRRPACRC